MLGGVSIDGYSNQTSFVLKGIWLQGDGRGCTVEGGEVPRVVAHSAGFAKRPPPAESLYLQVKEDVDLRRGPIPWAYLSMCLNSGSPGPLGSRVRRLCVALCWSLSAVPAGQSWPELARAACCPLLDRKPGWAGTQAAKEGARSRLG